MMRLLLVLAALLAVHPQPRVREVVPVGVGYEGGPAAAAEFARIASLGFNTVVLRGERGDAAELLAVARRAGLRAVEETNGAPSFLAPAPLTSADVRLRGWEAIARGRRELYFPHWTTSAVAAGLLEADGSVGPRARTAGEFAGIVSRNASLFASLRPRDAGRAGARTDAENVEVSLLESATATLIVAINHAERAERATLRFPPDTPEAIWSNLETGAAVGFVLERDGPSLTHSFLARDVLVLVRARRLQ